MERAPIRAAWSHTRSGWSTDRLHGMPLRCEARRRCKSSDLIDALPDSRRRVLRDLRRPLPRGHDDDERASDTCVRSPKSQFDESSTGAASALMAASRNVVTLRRRASGWDAAAPAAAASTTRAMTNGCPLQVSSQGSTTSRYIRPSGRESNVTERLVERPHTVTSVTSAGGVTDKHAD